MQRHNQIQATIYLTPEQKSALEKLSKATRVPQAAYLREAVDLLLKKHAAQLKGGPKK